ncbi:MAG TPA: right-handed parallel beta-helix repeat-containing protein [Haliangiales bacterium]|nr:right-handed parallel beta-helix repeat-containing protein [Haliangiales bacterium]
MRPWLVALVFALGVALGETARATTFYVQPGGDDNGPGSSANPWGTLQAAADKVGAGDTVIVRAGTYAGFDLRTTGTAALPIAFQAEANVSIVADNARTPDGINVEGDVGNEIQYIVIDGFIVNGRARAGIRAARCRHVTIRNNKTDANGRWGIFTGFCDDLLIEGNECSHSVAEHGIYVSNSGDRPTIRRNVSHDNRANGIHMNGDVSQGGDGIISGALVEANVIYGNGAGGGSGINCDGVQGSTFRNNLLFDNHASGISLYMIDGAAGAIGNVVVNNTIVVAADGRWAVNIQNASTGNKLYNNILFHAGARGAVDISADSQPGFVSNHNVVTDRFVIGAGSFLSLAAWRTATGQDADSVVGTPADTFVDAAAGNYRPKPAGPAAGRGDAAQAPPTDIDGTPRTPPVEAGAYELGGSPPPDAGPGAPDAAPGTADAAPATADAPGAPRGEAVGCSCCTSGGGSWLGALVAAAIVVFVLSRRGRKGQRAR